jgi:hypothetical protein
MRLPLLPLLLLLALPAGPSRAQGTPAPGAASSSSPGSSPDAAQAGASAQQAPEGGEEGGSPLVPGWEEARLEDRDVAEAKVRFRPGKGLEVRSTDGDFSVALRLRAQILYDLVREPAEDGGGGATFTEALQIRRARVGFSGNVFGEHNRYKFELAVSPRDEQTTATGVGLTPLLDWYLTFDHLPAATVLVGQYKVPFNRQRVISSGSMQMVDRSLIQAEFNLDRDLGAEVRASEPLGGLLRYYAGVFIGEGRNAYEERQPGLMYLGRLELLPFGEFEDYVVTDFERSLRPRLSLGAAYAYQQNSRVDRGVLGRPPTDGGTTDFRHLTADVLFQLGGGSLLAEGFLRRGFRTPGDATDGDGAPLPVARPRDGWGFFVQGGYLLPRSGFELTARYGELHPTGGPGTTAASALTELHEAGVGANYFFAQHTLKLQADYFRLWEDAGPAAGSDQVRVLLEAGF